MWNSIWQKLIRKLQMNASNIIRIGTRDSQLALWQANRVKDLLELQGYQCELVPTKSEGDIDLITPLYAMGVEGVFTKTLDAYLLSNKIDIAVHSMKDVPTQLAQGITQAAVLERGNVNDVLIVNREILSVSEILSIFDFQFSIGTGSVRRKAQWLHRYPNTQFENLRGNVQTRLRKLNESNWHGIIMAQAGLERMNLLSDNYELLDWMLPAPAQGAIMVVCRENDKGLFEKIHKLDHEQTALCTKIERDFLKTLMGGCSTPISALAEIKNETLYFKGNILSPDGKEKREIEKEVDFLNADGAGVLAAKELLREGVDKIVEAIRNIK